MTWTGAAIDDARAPSRQYSTYVLTLIFFVDINHLW
jgi:hypothetical protein